jgi:hypothetical protein
MRIVGPIPGHFSCVRGRGCNPTEPVQGIGLQAGDSVRTALVQCGVGLPVDLFPADSDLAAEARGRALTVSAEAGAKIGDELELLFGFGASPVTVQPRGGSNAYRLCWCGAGAACAEMTDFFPEAGALEVTGPNLGHEQHCNRGQHCSLSGISGVGLMVDDRIMVQEECGRGASISGVPGGGVAVANAIGDITTDFQFLHYGADDAASSILHSIAGIFRLCFCRLIDEGTCEEGQDFRADLGLFIAKGPYKATWSCLVDRQCVVPVNGIGLRDSDMIALSDAPCIGSSDQGMDKWGLPAAPISGEKDGHLFDFGTLSTQAVPGQYWLCWMPGSSLSSLAMLGEVTLSCPAGFYRLRRSSLGTGEPDRCEVCPQGLYCPGGEGTDEKIRCSSDKTTLDVGAGSVHDCLCSPGRFFYGLGVCESCAEGRYKAGVGNVATCAGACPDE